MIPGKFKIYLHWLSLPAFSIVSVYIAWACAGYIADDSAIHHLFHQQLGIPQTQKSLWFTIGEDFSDEIPSDSNHLKYELDLNLKNKKEWELFLKTEFSDEDFTQMMECDSIQKHGMEWFTQGKICSHYPENSFFRALRIHGGKKAGQYWDLAMKVQNAIYPQFNYETWTYDTMNFRLINQIQKEVNKQLTKNYPSFLSDRLAYLNLRLLITGNSPSNALAFYEKWFKDKNENNSIYHRAHSWKAGVWYQNGEYEKAAIEYMRIYRDFPELRSSALLSFRRCIRFHPNYVTQYQPYDASTSYYDDGKGLIINSEGLAPGVSVYQYLQNEEEKAYFLGLYLTKSYLPGSTDLLNKMMERHPGTVWGPILISRGMAQIENEMMPYFQTPEHYTSFREENKRNVKFEEWSEWINKWASHPSISNPELWKLAQAYLEYIHGDIRKADEILKSLLSSKQENIKNHASAFRVLMSALPASPLFNLTSKQIVESVNLIKNLKLASAPDFLNLYFQKCKAYFKKNNDVRAEWMDLISYPEKDINRFQFENNMRVMLQVLHEDPDLAELLNKQYPHEVNAVRLGNIRNMMLNENWEGANQALAALPAIFYLPISLQFPFEFSFYNKPELPNSMDLKEFCKKMREYGLKTQNPQSANYIDALQKYATGLFNMSFFGNSWVYLKNYRSAYEVPIFPADREEYWTPAPKNEIHLLYYQVVSRARQYFHRAASRTAQPEKAAELYFMAARCEQALQFAQTSFDENTPIDKVKVWKSDFYTLFLRYRNTEYYHHLLDECGYLAYWDKVFSKSPK